MEEVIVQAGQTNFLVQYYRMICAFKPHSREWFDITAEAVSQFEPHLLAANRFKVESIYQESYLQGNQNWAAMANVNNVDMYQVFVF